MYVRHVCTELHLGACPSREHRGSRTPGEPAWVTATLRLCFTEEAVNEVKRQAMSELQKAVSDAERKAHELITTERAKMERALAEAKRQASEDALTVINQQEDSSEVGLPASRCTAVCGLTKHHTCTTSRSHALSALSGHGCHRCHKQPCSLSALTVSK